MESPEAKSLLRTQSESELRESLEKNSGDMPIRAYLKTSERVFARITDGIYREPASALRELIANAYDADATEVRVETDAPRFSRIVVRDNGVGLSEAVLAHIVYNIGGSLKRTNEGKEFKLVNDADSGKSLGGRDLIGKLGIGLFSVSQLTHHLIIVTKTQGSNFRLVCDILLRPQSDEEGDAEDFITGDVEIHKVPAEDVESHGTEITLLDIRPFVRESLQSLPLWQALRIEEEKDQDSDDFEDDLDEDDVRARPVRPDYHIGQVCKDDPELLVAPPNLPWGPGQSPLEKFFALYESVIKLAEDSRANVKITERLDTYLRMIWQISLSIPIPYIGKHPFDLSVGDGVPVYQVSNKAKGREAKADEVILLPQQSVREKLGLKAGLSLPKNFDVYIDDLLLRRPISFGPIPWIDYESSPPLLFVGRQRPDLSRIPEEYRGGELEFEAYLYWTPKVIPTEHNGVLVRIREANGTLFDERFLKYQVSELTRLRQITAEIFIVKGLDAALNIDRESFNVAHTHYQYISRWLHNALKQLMTRHKSLTKATGDSGLVSKAAIAEEQLRNILSTIPKSDASAPAREVRFFSEGEGRLDLEPGIVGFSEKRVFSSRFSEKPVTKRERLRDELFSKQIMAVAKVLDGFGLLHHLSEEQRNDVLQKIVQIFSIELRNERRKK